MAVDASAFRAALGQWPTGVAIVTTLDGERWAGMTASSFSSVSLDPPLVSVCLGRSVRTHDLLGSAGVFAVTILGKDQAALGQRFARFDPDAPDRFAGEEWRTAETGCPVQLHALGWLDCRVAHAYDGGDHTIFVGEVLAAATPRQTSPLLYHSRAWGQLADVLPDQVLVIDVEPGDDGVVLEGVFDLAPVDAAELVAAHPDASSVVLADVTGTATPLAVREVCREVLQRRGDVPLRVRLTDAGGYAQANLLTALKSGLHRVDVGPDSLARSTVEHLARGLDLTVIGTS